MTAQTINPLTNAPQRKGRQRTDLSPEQLAALNVFTIVEAAAFLRVGPDLIRRAVRSGDLASENYGNTSRPVYRIHRAQLDAWRAGRIVTPAEGQ